MGRPLIDMTGQVVGRLLVTGPAGNRSWNCICSCGTRVVVKGNNLRFSTRSCGCLKRELQIARNITHGLTYSSEFSSWQAMKARCYGVNNRRYPDWGGRGITVCDRWRGSFENFYADMGEKPTLTHSIDRIDNDGNYCPENCRWATVKEQNANKRKRKLREKV